MNDPTDFGAYLERTIAADPELAALVAEAEREGHPCVVCGLPQTRNPHPDAGKPSHLNILGAMWGCLPCAERRANGRHRVIADLKSWLDRELKEGMCPEFVAAIRKVKIKVAELDEARRVKFHEQK